MSILEVYLIWQIWWQYFIYYKLFWQILDSVSNLPGRVCVITVKLIQDPACCEEKGTVSCMFYVKQNGKFSQALHGKIVILVLEMGEEK